MPLGSARVGMLGSGVAIPDSEADQKLVHRWYYGLDGPFVDQIGSNDATNNGTTEVTGDWVDGAAREGDGNDDYVDHTTLGSFGSDISDSDGFAIAVSYKGTEALAGGPFIMGTVNDGDNTHFQIPDDQNGDAALYVQDEDGNDARIEWADHGNFEDDNPHRLVYNIPSSDDASTWEIWADKAEESVSVNKDDTVDNTADFEYPLAIFARNVRGTVEDYSNIILDDICIFGESLTQSEIESYQNPWD